MMVFTKNVNRMCEYMHYAMSICCFMAVCHYRKFHKELLRYRLIMYANNK
ncbi:hypothetical protein SAMN02910417_00166 [Eubacterium oxidoreducens]|uniref:Uncharacterized protein n=1 Tax=Eubacterium oxidoreducens TaxID=1732 RepID=A0A1G6A1Z2_EUBOX|nr:hypothetical protein SAMN02910417_00166 [Eubacterium oxidoreducens]